MEQQPQELTVRRPSPPPSPSAAAVHHAVVGHHSDGTTPKRRRGRSGGRQQQQQQQRDVRGGNAAKADRPPWEESSVPVAAVARRPILAMLVLATTMAFLVSSVSAFVVPNQRARSGLPTSTAGRRTRVDDAAVSKRVQVGGDGGQGGDDAEDASIIRPAKKSGRKRKKRGRKKGTADGGGGGGDDGGRRQSRPMIDAGGGAAAQPRPPSTRAESYSSGSSNDDGGEAGEGDLDATPAETLRGGPSLIFAMARRMLVWDDENYVGQNDTYRGGRRANQGGGDSSASASAARSAPTTATSRSRPPPILPRWHPHEGISDVNPAFRSRPPVMNARGYGAAIRRNSRKRSKPSMWRHALRTYDKMRALEEEAIRAEKEEGGGDGAGGCATGAGAGAATGSRRKLTVTRSAVHHEGAMVACAKLGLWKDAFRIYDEVAAGAEESKKRGGEASASSSSSATYGRAKDGVTDNMVLSLVRACIRGSKAPELRKLGVEKRRVPLDRVAEVLLDLEEKHDIPVDASHMNPLAAAYQSLGLSDDAANLLQTCLADRTTPLPDTDSDPTASTININDLCAKDRASYGILVRAAVTEGDWAGAVEALSDMNEAGMYPTSRDVNVWSEVAEKRERRGRNKRSWKKRRDEYWMDGLR